MLINCSNAEYHARPELSSSQLAAFILDPIDFHHTHIACDWPRPEPSPAMQFGTQVHELIETGQPPHIVRIPDEVLTSNGQKRGKAFDAWKAEQPPGATLLKSTEIDWREPLWQHLRANSFTSRWLDCPQKEVSFVWTHEPTGIECRCRLDLLDEEWGLVVDWKTAADVSHRGFSQAAMRHLYHIRLAFYQQGFRELTGDTLNIVTVAIKNSRSWQVVPFEMGEDWLTVGRNDMDAAMEELAIFRMEDYLNKPIGCLPMPGWVETCYEEG